jgi:hypothetical protein
MRDSSETIQREHRHARTDNGTSVCSARLCGSKVSMEEKKPPAVALGNQTVEYSFLCNTRISNDSLSRNGCSLRGAGDVQAGRKSYRTYDICVLQKAQRKHRSPSCCALFRAVLQCDVLLFTTVRYPERPDVATNPRLGKREPGNVLGPA